MANITIFGQGNMGQAIASVFTSGGHEVDFVGKEGLTKRAGDIVVLAVPYVAIASILEANKAELAGKILVDISNPVNFENMDELLTPAGSSAAEEIAKLIPEARVVKAFNTNFAAASDDQEAKKILAGYIQEGGLDTIDAGELKRARELEAMGFLQITLAVREKINWTAGFAVIK